MLQGEVLDYVLHPEQKSGKPSPNDSERRKSLASALEKAAAMNPYAEVDPVAWMSEQRDGRAKYRFALTTNINLLIAEF